MELNYIDTLPEELLLKISSFIGVSNSACGHIVKKLIDLKQRKIWHSSEFSFHNTLENNYDFYDEISGNLD